MTNTKRLLRSFCHHGHHTLSKPWSIAEYTYYSDEHIIIRTLRDKRVKENPACPDARKLDWDNHSHPTIIPAWPDDEETRSKIDITPEGRLFAAALSEHGVLLQVALVLKIQKLPGIMMEDAPQGSVRPVYFKFNGGDGLLMPVLEEEAQRQRHAATSAAPAPTRPCAGTSAARTEAAPSRPGGMRREMRRSQP